MTKKESLTKEQDIDKEITYIEKELDKFQEIMNKIEDLLNNKESTESTKTESCPHTKMDKITQDNFLNCFNTCLSNIEKTKSKFNLEPNYEENKNIAKELMKHVATALTAVMTYNNTEEFHLGGDAHLLKVNLEIDIDKFNELIN